MRSISLLSILLLGATAALAQAPGSGAPQSSTRAAQVPLSGSSPQTGAVTSQQSPVSGSGAATINSSIQVGGSFAGSVPAANIPSGPISLTLGEAVKRGLDANLGPIAANDAARAERLPSVSLNGSYGVIGPNPASTHGVFAVTGSVNVPVWNGGRTHGDIEQATAVLNQRQAELADQRGRIEQDVRIALIELQTASGQVRVGESNRGLANETLTQARDRFSAGVATTVEVVQAQQQLATAESDYISSLYSFNLAKLSLARATGEAESNLSETLKGSHP
jgi:hypothetical protein